MAQRLSYARTQVLLIACAVFSLVAQPAPTDTLVVPWLSAADENLFDTSGVSIAPFWDQWAGRDSILLLGDRDTVPGYGRFAARVVVKVAGGAQGLYVFARIADSTSRLVKSGLTLYHDSIASSYIDTCTSCLDLLWCFLYTSKALRYPVLAPVSPPEDGFTLYWGRENLMCGLCFERYAFSTGSQMFGLFSKRVARADSQVIVEYRMPWAMLRALRESYRFPPAAGADIVPASHSHSAFSVDYYSIDSSQSDTGLLAWRHVTPWSAGLGHDCRFWGDLVFGEGFPAVATPVESLLAVVPRPFSSSTPQSAIDRSGMEYFSITGRKIDPAASSGSMATGLVVRRTSTPNGTATTRLESRGR
jgi:hypothetical protein